MLRLALILGAAIYAGLVIFSTASPDATGRVEVSRAASAVDVTAPIAPGSDIFVTADGRELPIAAEIDPGKLEYASAEIALVSTRATDIVTASTSLPEVQDLPLVEVTGDHVNLRAGPSTNDAVLDALIRGAQAELIAEPGNGWVQIRAVETGVEGYMADRFVTPLN